MKRVVLVAALVPALGGLACSAWSHGGPSVVGVWKATDEHGHEHYWEFHKDGTLDYWDRTRAEGDKFKESPRFKGTYSAVDGKTVAAKKAGYLPEPLGKLTLVSENELKQDGNGEAARHTLVYRRVAPE
jgi:hypothetical protein